MGQGDQLKGLNVFTDIQHFRWELRRMFYSVTEKLGHCSFSFPVSPYRSIGGNERDSGNDVDHFCRLLCKIEKTLSTPGFSCCTNRKLFLTTVHFLSGR